MNAILDNSDPDSETESPLRKSIDMSLPARSVKKPEELPKEEDPPEPKVETPKEKVEPEKETPQVTVESISKPELVTPNVEVPTSGTLNKNSSEALLAKESSTSLMRAEQ